MVDKVDDWVLDALGKTISSRGDLVALSLVSKRFNAIFTPHLYRRLWLGGSKWDNVFRLATLSPEQNMRNSRDFYISVVDEPPSYALSFQKTQLFLHSFLRAKNLRSFTYVKTFCLVPLIVFAY